MLIKNDQQILETSRYIHLNPIRAKMVKLPEEYKWSSYGAFKGKINLRRFRAYEAILSHQTGKDVLTYVVYSGNIKNTENILK